MFLDEYEEIPLEALSLVHFFHRKLSRKTGSELYTLGILPVNVTTVDESLTIKTEDV